MGGRIERSFKYVFCKEVDVPNKNVLLGSNTSLSDVISLSVTWCQPFYCWIYCLKFDVVTCNESCGAVSIFSLIDR